MKKVYIVFCLLLLVLIPSCNNGDGKKSSSSLQTSESSSSSSSIPSSESSSSVTSIVSSINPLDERKEEGLLELETYFNTFNQENYSTENWAALLSAYEAGKIIIEASTSLPEILSAVSNTKAAMEAIEQLPISISLIDIKVVDDEYLQVYISLEIDRLSTLLPVSNVTSTIKAMQFHTIEEIEGKTSITLKAAATDLTKGEFDVSMDISAIDSTMSTISFTVLNGILKTIENYRIYSINELNNYVINRDLTEDKYTPANYQQLQTYLQNGINAINSATDFESIINITTETKYDVSGVEQIGVDLATFKFNAKAELTDHVNSKNQESYNPVNWSQIQNHLTVGKAMIDSKTTQRDVVVALHTYLTKIDEVEKIYKVQITPTNAFTYGVNYIEIQFNNLQYKTTYKISATFNGNDITVYNDFEFGTTGSAVQLMAAGEDVMGGTYTLTVTFLDGYTAYTSTINIINGQWAR